MLARLNTAGEAAKARCRSNWSRLRLTTLLGAQLSEVLNEEVTRGKKGEFSRRRVVKGVAWSVPVIVTAVAVPPASASPGPTPTPTVTPATATFTAAAQAMASTQNGHSRTSVTVPTTLSLKNLGSVVGEIEVVITISPQPASATAPTVKLSTVKIGTAPVTVAAGLTGNTSTATFKVTPQTGATELDLTLGGYSYTGKRQDVFTYAVTTVITLQQGAKTVQLTPASTIELVKS